jgi:hypothetical protein
MSRIAAMLYRRARRVPNPDPRGFALDDDFAIVVGPSRSHPLHRFETNGPGH